MNWDQIRCSLCCLCLCGTLLAPLTLKQEVVGSNTTFYKFLFRIGQNIIRKNSNGTISHDKIKAIACVTLIVV